MTETEIAAGVQPDSAPDAEIAVAAAAKPPWDDRQTDFIINAAEAKKRPELYQRRAFLTYQDDVKYAEGSFWNLNHNGYQPRATAQIGIVGEMLKRAASEEYLFEILLDRPREPRPDGRKSDLSEHFAANFIERLQSAPNNLMVRAHMMKVLKQLPPGELDTFEQLKDWVEKNFFAVVTPPAASPDVRPAPRTQPTIGIEFTASETESGRCRYSVNRRGSHSEPVTLSQLTEWINEGCDLDEILSNIKDEASSSGNIEMDDYGDYSYEDHEANDTDNFSIELQTPYNTAVERIRELLSEHAPEALETLDNN